MKFKTKRDSETGKKLTVIFNKMQACKNQQSQLAKSIGFTKYRHKEEVAFGGIGCVHFDKIPDLKKWQKTQDGYLPKPKGKKGKQLTNLFESLMVVEAKELCEAIGLETSQDLRIPGIYFDMEDIFVIEVEKNWSYKAPKDCFKILEKTFNKLREE